MKIGRPAVVNSILGTVIVLAIAAGLLVWLNPFASSQSVAMVQLDGTVLTGTVSSTISARGAIAPAAEVASSFAVGGTIRSIAVAPGMTVTAGQILGTLESTTLQAALSNATASLAADQTSLAESQSALATAQSNVTTGNAAAMTPSSVSAVGTVGDVGTSSPAPSSSHGSGSSSPSAGSGSGAAGSSGIRGSTGAAGTNRAATQGSLASAQAQVTSAELTVSNAEFALAAASANLASATLTAPMSGLVVAVSGSIGDSVRAGSVSKAITPSGAATAASQGLVVML